jgi:hypothetical protein
MVASERVTRAGRPRYAIDSEGAMARLRSPQGDHSPPHGWCLAERRHAVQAAASPSGVLTSSTGHSAP